MTLETNDPRLTAYALGELSPAEAAEIEGMIQADPEARKTLEDIRTAARLVQEALGMEPAPALTASQRAAATTPPVRGRLLRFPAVRVSDRWGTAAAAVLVVAVGTGLVLRTNVGPVLYWLNQVKSSTGHDSALREELAGNPVTVGDILRAGGDTTKAMRAAEGLPPLANGSPTGQYAGDAGQMAWQQPALGAAAAPPAAPSYWAQTPAAGADDSWYRQDFNTEGYDQIQDNPFRLVSDEPLSTFSIDVDTASYANVRRFLNEGVLPPPDAVRIEELLNYFPYDYAPPTGEDGAPFAVHTDVASAPWDATHRLVRVGLKGREVDTSARPPANLVFLVDVSGSMDVSNKLPLVQEALRMMAQELRPDDRVALVVYAGASGMVLPSTPVADQARLLAAIDVLQAGGTTNGGEGIQLAYRVAQDNFVPGGANRVILCTDGDFNVGVTDRGSLVSMVEQNAKGGVFLTVLGFGMGNYKDDMLESLADKGNGNYGYIDTVAEARKVLVEQATGTLLTIAKDVKIQVEFNPATVSAYRLIGYENRVLANQDFNDDTKDAGEIGAGHTVTALYEVVPVGAQVNVPGVDPLKYQQPSTLSAAAQGGALLTVKLRYKEPDGDNSKLLEQEVADGYGSMETAAPDFQFASAVAAFGMLLRGSPYRGQSTYDLVLGLAQRGIGLDPGGYRAEFVRLVGTARALDVKAALPAASTSQGTAGPSDQAPDVPPDVSWPPVVVPTTVSPGWAP